MADKKISLSVNLSAPQKAILGSKARFKLVRAGRRFGKTYLSVYWLAKMAIKHPKSVGWFVAAELKQAREVSMPLLKSMLPPGSFTEQKADMSITLFNGSVIRFKTAENMDTLRGRSIDFLVMEEFAIVRHQHELWYDILRPQLADRKGQAMFISSPMGNNTFKRIEEDAKTDPEWEIFHYSIYDNPLIDREEIESIRKKTNSDTWEQEYLANYVDHIGQVYFEFNPTEHVNIDIPGIVKATVRGLDWGIDDNTACIWIHLLDSGKLHISDELVVNNTIIPVIADGIKQKTVHTVYKSIMDSSAFARESDFSSVTDRFRQQGIVLTPATKDKDATINAVKELFTSGIITVSPNCVNILEAIKEWSYGSHEPDCLAAMRYGISYLITAGGVKLPKVDVKKNRSILIADFDKEARRNENLMNRLNNQKCFTILNPSRLPW